MKVGELIESNKRNIFFKCYAENEVGETISRHPFIIKGSLIWGKSNWSAAYFKFISIALNYAYNKNKLHKTLDYWSTDIVNFNFSEKGRGLVSHFVYNFSRNMFLMLYSINWPNFDFCLPLLLEILANMCITIVC